MAGFEDVRRCGKKDEGFLAILLVVCYLNCHSSEMYWKK